MALINHVKREINAKLVYFGPAHSGKTTNLNVIFRKLKPECRGKLKSMAVQQDRMLFFDFMVPGQGKVDGYQVRFHVYTLAGKVTSDAAWKMVLKGADGVVFVADSASNKMAANRENLAALREQLQGAGKVPCVVQFNKRDLSDAVPLEEIRQALVTGNCPVVPTVAAKGEGVLDALFAVIKTVMQTLKESGLELEGGAENLGGLTVPEEPAAPELTSRLAGEEAGATSQMAAEVAVESGPAASENDAPTIEVDGEPVAMSDGRLRLPLTVRYGGKEKKFAVMLALSLESEDTAQ